MGVELNFINKNEFAVLKNGYLLGSILLYENKYHNKNQYVKFKFRHYDCTMAKEIVLQLKNKINRPLQVMISSDKHNYIEFLKCSGFVCKRKCFDIVASKEDYVGGNFAKELSFCQNGDSIYEQTCQTMFKYYCEIHKDINPWTAGYNEFCDILPKNAVYQIKDNKIQNFAFIEKNEIAYIACVNKIECEDFAKSLIKYLFDNYKTLKFEIDDCNHDFFFLKKWFKNQNNVSFDTYIYD